GPLLPAQHGGDPPAAAPRARRGPGAAGPDVPRRLRPRVREAGHQDRPRRDGPAAAAPLARERAGAAERDRARRHPGGGRHDRGRGAAGEPPGAGPRPGSVRGHVPLQHRGDGAAAHRGGAGTLPDPDAGGRGARRQPPHALQQDPPVRARLPRASRRGGGAPRRRPGAGRGRPPRGLAAPVGMSGATGPTAASRGSAAAAGDGLVPGGGGVDLTLATSLPALHALRPEWERLEAEVDGATVYQTWAWVVSWYEHFGADKRIAVAAARAGGRRLVAVVPLSAAGGGPAGARLLHFLGRGNELTEYVDGLVRPEHAGAVTRAVFDWWDARRRQWDLWRLPSAPVESLLVPELRAAAAARRYAIVADEATRVTLPLPSSWEAFQAGLGRNMRKHLRKFANRLERDAGPPKLVTVTDVDALGPALDAFFDLHSRRAAADITRRHEERFPTPIHRGFLRA